MEGQKFTLYLRIPNHTNTCEHLDNHGDDSGCVCYFDKICKSVQEKPRVIAETIVTVMDGLVGQTMGKDKMKFAPWMLALIMFLAFANTAGIYGLRSPTADLNCTVGLALMTFFMTQFFGLKSKGIGRLPQRVFLEPKCRSCCQLI